MRHGDASLHAASDALRPLTQKGIDDSCLMAQWLETRAPQIDKILVSPYLRAEQTLSAIRPILTLPREAEIMKGLTPSGDADLIASYVNLLASEGFKSILIVSHLPLVGYLVSAFCPQEQPPMFATSSIACIDVDVQTYKGKVEWQLCPSQLQSINP